MVTSRAVYQNSRVMRPAYQASTPTPAARPLSTTVPGRVSTRSRRTPAGSSGSGTWKLSWEDSWSSRAGSRGPRPPSRISSGVKLTAPSRAPSLPVTSASPSSGTSTRTRTPSSPMASDPPWRRSASSRLTSASVSSMVPSARSTVIRPGSPSSTSRGTRTPWRVSWSWAALIPLALASVAATSMVEKRPVELVLALELGGDAVLEHPGGDEVGGRAQQDQDDDGDQEFPHEGAQVATGRAGRSTPARSAAGERRQQGQLGPVGDRGGRVAPALAVHQHARVAEHGHEAVAEAVAELVQDDLEGGRRRLHLGHAGRLPEGREQSDPDHVAMVGCAAVRCGGREDPALEDIGWPSSPA